MQESSNTVRVHLWTAGQDSDGARTAATEEREKMLRDETEQ